jgi:Flp pilus assembly pilin Flp
MKGLMVRFVREDEGQDLIEYALLATVVSMAVFAGATLAGGALNGWYTGIAGVINGWAGQLP